MQWCGSRVGDAFWLSGGAHFPYFYQAPFFKMIVLCSMDSNLFYGNTGPFSYSAEFSKTFKPPADLDTITLTGKELMKRYGKVTEALIQLAEYPKGWALELFARGCLV
jgi:hypothetical protein